MSYRPRKRGVGLQISENPREYSIPMNNLSPVRNLSAEIGPNQVPEWKLYFVFDTVSRIHGNNHISASILSSENRKLLYDVSGGSVTFQMHPRNGFENNIKCCERKVRWNGDFSESTNLEENVFSEKRFMEVSECKVKKIYFTNWSVRRKRFEWNAKDWKLLLVICKSDLML